MAEKATRQDMASETKSGRNINMASAPATTSFSGTSTLTMEQENERYVTGRLAQPEERSDRVLKNMEVFRKPICLVSTDRENVLKLETGTVKQIAKIDWPIVVVSIVGLYRTGKSYLMNRLAGEYTGFVMGNTIESTTKGIWVWCKVHPKKPKTVLMLLDTEGLGDVKKGDANHDNKMFTLATLLCNCLVYNMKGVFDQDAISKLTFISEMAKNIRYNDTCSDDNSNLKKITPDFVLCLRDFSLKLSVNGITITENEYLERALAMQESKDITFNKMRECIRRYFPERSCFTFPVPGDGNVLENIESLPNNKLSASFNEATARFVEHINSCKAKELFFSKPINGQMFTELADIYVTAIRKGAVPDVDDAFSAVAKSENTRARKTAFEMFKTEMSAVTLPAPSADLDELYTRSQQKALDYMRKSVVHYTDVQFELEIQMEMNNVWNNIKEENTKKVGKMCDAKLQQSCRESIKAKIKKGNYAKPGGYRKFQREIESLRKFFFNSLRGYEQNETYRTWYGFLEEIKPMEEKIIEDDETLSKQEKEDDRKRYEESVKMIKDHQKSAINGLKEQWQKSEERYKKLQSERLELLTKHQQEFLDHCKTKLEKDEIVKEYKELSKEIEEKKMQMTEVQEKENAKREVEFKRQLDEIERQHEKVTRQLLLEVQEKEKNRREDEFKMQLEEKERHLDEVTRQLSSKVQEKETIRRQHEMLTKKLKESFAKEQRQLREELSQREEREKETIRRQYEMLTKKLKESFANEQRQLREELSQREERAAKKSLQEEYIRKKIQQNCLEKKFEQASHKVQEVANEYARCKRHIPFRRYGELKNMIKEIRRDIEGMKNTELERRLEETKRTLTRINKTVNEFDLRFAELQQEYQQSKNYSRFRLYRAMKFMLKSLINNSPQTCNVEGE